MLERAHALPNEPDRTATAARIRRGLALAVTAAAVAAVLVRLPGVFHTLDSRASFNAKESPIGRTIQAADGLAIDDQFAVEALTLLPRNATFAVEQPATLHLAQQYGIPPTTLLALEGYMRFLLLPRREVPAARAEYVLCYACNTDPFDKRGMKRLWTDPHGYVIGRLPR